MDYLDRFRIRGDLTRFGEGGEAVVWETRCVTGEADLGNWRRRWSFRRRKIAGGRGLARGVAAVVGGLGRGGVEEEG